MSEATGAEPTPQPVRAVLSFRQKVVLVVVTVLSLAATSSGTRPGRR